MERGQGNGLEHLASALNSASDKLDARLPLAEGDVRMLRALRAAATHEPRVRARPLLLAAAAAVVLLGFFAAFHLLRPRGPGVHAIDLAMVPADGTRAGGGWRAGDPFALKVILPEELYLFVVHLDAAGRVELVFPFHDEKTGGWNHLGHASNRLPGGSPVSIPAPGFPMDLKIESSAPGEETFLAGAGHQPISEAQLLSLRDELRRAVEEGRQKKASIEGIAARLRNLLAERAGAASGLLRYEVERP